MSHHWGIYTYGQSQLLDGGGGIGCCGVIVWVWSVRDSVAGGCTKAGVWGETLCGNEPRNKPIEND